MQFGVLGPLAVWTADGEPVEIPERKVRALLANLLVHHGRPVSAKQLIDDLWGDHLPADPAAALRTKVSQLRRALDAAEPGGRGLVVHQQSGYVLEVGADALDAGRFSRLIEHAQGIDDLRTLVTLLSDALSLWRGAPLADFADDQFTWQASIRWQEQRLAAIEERAEALLGLGEHRALTGEMPELILAHPLRERLRSVHMRALYRSGRQSDALASYRDLRTRLVEELGVEPSPELTALQLAILQQDPSLDGPSPSPEPSGRRSNLPAPATELIGRDEAIVDVHTLLESNRLVTLTGPGGVGKTRLAVAVASQKANAVPGGVWMVELAGLPDADDGGVTPNRELISRANVAYAVANVLGIRDDAALMSDVSADHKLAGTGDHVDPIDRLVHALAERKCLIVLDNCEHVVVPVARLTERLLRAAPGVQILATSREPLRITGEVLWEVPPLGVPGNGMTANPLAVEHSTAVELFVTRAAAAAPGFSLDTETAPWVVTICQRLDGIPLALELAATRVRALGVRELAARLDDRFRVLARGSRDAAARHQTLEAMIDWSWERLTATEQSVLRRLAASADSYDLDAAEHLCAGEDVATEDVLEILTDLVDRSLVVVSDARRPRYQLLESVAAYCGDRLAEAGEMDRVREGHDRYFTELAERSSIGLRGPSQRDWLDRLDADANNVRDAFDGAIQRSDAELALRLVNPMAWFWFLRGRYGDAHRWLARALRDLEDEHAAAKAEAAALHAGFARWVDRGARCTGTAAEVLTDFDDLDAPAAKARAQWFLALTDFGVSDAETGDVFVEDALATFTSLDDRWGTAAALALRADRAFVLRGDLGTARRDAERCVAMFHELGDRWGEMQALQVLSPLAEIAGDYATARRLASEMADIAAYLGMPTEMSYALSRLGRIALLDGDHLAADDFHHRARQIAIEQPNWITEEYAEIGLALSARRSGRLDEAETYLAKWLNLNQRQENPTSVGFLWSELGFVAELRGDADLALARQIEGGAAALATQDPRAIALSLEGLAGALGLADREHVAARCLGAAAAMRESVGVPLPEAERCDVDRITKRLRATLGDAALEAELQRGAGSDPYDLVGSLSPA